MTMLRSAPVGGENGGPAASNPQDDQPGRRGAVFPMNSNSPPGQPLNTSPSSSTNCASSVRTCDALRPVASTFSRIRDQYRRFASSIRRSKSSMPALARWARCRHAPEQYRLSRRVGTNFLSHAAHRTLGRVTGRDGCTLSWRLTVSPARARLAGSLPGTRPSVSRRPLPPSVSTTFRTRAGGCRSVREPRRVSGPSRSHLRHPWRRCQISSAAWSLWPQQVPPALPGHRPLRVLGAVPARRPQPGDGPAAAWSRAEAALGLLLSARRLACHFHLAPELPLAVACSRISPAPPAHVGLPPTPSRIVGRGPSQTTPSTTPSRIDGDAGRGRG